MQRLGLTGNNLTRKLPTTICDHLPNLERLYLSVNNLDDRVRQLTALTNLFLRIQHLEGEIPMELGNLKNLQVLTLTGNGFSGFIPARIFNMSALYILSLDDNRFSGRLPSGLGCGLPSLEEFYCGKNNLNGFVSASISNSSRLRILELSYNDFACPIPESLGNLEHLEFLNLQSPEGSDELYIDFGVYRLRKRSVLHNSRKLHVSEPTVSRSAVEFHGRAGDFAVAVGFRSQWWARPKFSRPRPLFRCQR
uniref:Leucine-rich repeat receptor-like protein kinase PEPR1 n=1 Tax=Nicotiana tabacum TaxID=4097 RepID=A0A1S4DCB3_TOBAC|nr:PREDICTED: leucine-rich repeat receptor-like protein kinase PEPR1 [Nicotiana tabacum]